MMEVNMLVVWYPMRSILVKMKYLPSPMYWMLFVTFSPNQGRPAQRNQEKRGEEKGGEGKRGEGKRG